MTRKVSNTLGDDNSGSFQLIIPKQWADDNHLHHGDTLELHLDTIAPRSILIQFPNEDNTPQPTELVLNDRDHDTGAARRRSILGGYLQGYDKIQLMNVSRVPAKRLRIRQDIQLLTQKLEGCFTNEEEDSFELQISTADRNPLDLLSKLYSTTYLMLEDVFRAYVEQDLILSEDLIQRDDQADKLLFAIIRALKTILRQPLKFSNQLDLVDTLDYRMVASNLENLCDACEYLAQAIRGENEEPNNIDAEEFAKLTKDHRNQIRDLASQLVESLQLAFKYYLENDEEKAVQLITIKSDVDRQIGILTAIGVHPTLINVIDEAIDTIVDLSELVHKTPQE